VFGLLIGAGLLLGSLLADNARLRVLGAVYVMASLAILCAHGPCPECTSWQGRRSRAEAARAEVVHDGCDASGVWGGSATG